MDDEYGKVYIILENYIKSRGLTKYKVAQEAKMSWQQLNNYCQNNISRLDIHAIEKICTVLQCNIEDIITFIPPH